MNVVANMNEKFFGGKISHVGHGTGSRELEYFGPENNNNGISKR